MKFGPSSKNPEIIEAQDQMVQFKANRDIHVDPKKSNASLNFLSIFKLMLSDGRTRNFYLFVQIVFFAFSHKKKQFYRIVLKAI